MKNIPLTFNGSSVLSAELTALDIPILKYQKYCFFNLLEKASCDQ